MKIALINLSHTHYITIYWLYRYVSYWSKGDERKVYAKWHVLNLLWSILEHELKKNVYRDQFRKMIEREKRYIKELAPLNILIKETFKLASSFYWKNKKIDGKIQNAQDFFKHINLDRAFYDYYNKAGQQKHRIEVLRSKFLNSIDNSKE